MSHSHPNLSINGHNSSIYNSKRLKTTQKQLENPSADEGSDIRLLEYYSAASIDVHNLHGSHGIMLSGKKASLKGLYTV